MGNWFLGDSGFLGYQFLLAGDTHYGWAQIFIHPHGAVTLERYAYETVANTPITTPPLSPTPEPSSIALMLLGAAGLAAYRRKRKNTPCNKGKMGVWCSRPRAQGGQLMKRMMANTAPVAPASAFEKRLASYGMMSLAVAGAAVVAPAAKADVIVFRTHGITTPRNGSIS